MSLFPIIEGTSMKIVFPILIAEHEEEIHEFSI
jgi:hypothetical protein